jgi:hypothetical protein
MMETQLEYVLRKLKDAQINVPAVAKEIGTSKQNLYNVIKNEDGKASLIDDLASHFRKLGE